MRGGGHRLSVFYRGGVVSGCSAKAEKEESEEMEKRSEENRTRIGDRVRWE